MSIVVTGASGAFGRMVTEALLKKVPPSQLMLATRTPAALAALSARGVSVRHADFDVAESLVAAFAGAEKILLISTLDVGERASHRIYLQRWNTSAQPRVRGRGPPGNRGDVAPYRAHLHIPA